MSQKNKKYKWDGKSRVATDLYRKRFNDIFKKDIITSIKKNTDFVEEMIERKMREKKQ